MRLRRWAGLLVAVLLLGTLEVAPAAAAPRDPRLDKVEAQVA